MSHLSKDIFFIIGRGRSGTDLFQRLLNTHNEICIPPETTVLPLLYSKYHAVKNWNNKELAAFCNDVFSDDKISNWWKLKKDKLEKFLINKKPQTFRDAIQCIYQYYALLQGKEKVILGDKNPANTLYVDEIFNVFPQSKFIVLTRNPLDNVNSFKNVSFDSNDVKVLAHRWNYYNLEVLKQKEKYPENILVIQFEELVNNTDQTLKKASKFLGIDNHFNIEKKEEGEQVWQKNLGNKISSKHVNKGKKELPKQDVKAVEYICQHVAHKLGYTEFEEKQNSTFHLIAWFFNRFEKNFIRLPLYLSSTILRVYRKKSKIIVEN